MDARLYHPKKSENSTDQHYQQLLSKQQILICQINDYKRMADCKRLADLNGTIAEYKENKYAKEKIELTEPVEHYLELKRHSEQALALINQEVSLTIAPKK